MTLLLLSVLEELKYFHSEGELKSSNRGHNQRWVHQQSGVNLAHLASLHTIVKFQPNFKPTFQQEAMTSPENWFPTKRTRHLSTKHALNQTSISQCNTVLQILQAQPLYAFRLASERTSSLVWRWAAGCRAQPFLNRKEINSCCKAASRSVLGELTALKVRGTSRSGHTKHFKPLPLIPLFCLTFLLRTCW